VEEERAVLDLGLGMFLASTDKIKRTSKSWGPKKKSELTVLKLGSKVGALEAICLNTKMSFASDDPQNSSRSRPAPPGETVNLKKSGHPGLGCRGCHQGLPEKIGG